MKLQQREISALAQEIKAKDEKETKVREQAFIAKFYPEAKKWVTEINKLPKVIREKISNYNFNVNVSDIATLLAKQSKSYPQGKYNYNNNIERVIILSMIDAKDMAELIKKVQAYKF